jgi:hypothetical protein
VQILFFRDKCSDAHAYRLPPYFCTQIGDDHAI